MNNTRKILEYFTRSEGKGPTEQELLIAIAVDYPDVFCQALDHLQGGPVQIENWHRTVWHHIYNGEAVNAIKCIRTNTGYGLYEAKQVYDHVFNEVQKLGLINGFRDPKMVNPIVHVGANKVVEAIVKAARNI